MTSHPLLRARQPLPALVLAALVLCAATPATAGPGAHGPNGEHLDGPATSHAASALPRLEAKSEAFELVAELRAGELSIIVDRYDSNEPVLGAKLEVESGTLKAKAAFRPEQGDYAVTDAALLKALASPGEHGLVFTLVAGNDSDLLDGTLGHAATQAAGTAAQGHRHTHFSDGHPHKHGLERFTWIGSGALALGLAGGMAWWLRNRRAGAKQQGGLS